MIGGSLAWAATGGRGGLTQSIIPSRRVLADRRSDIPLHRWSGFAREMLRSAILHGYKGYDRDAIRRQVE
jgi:hypothetical protein